jgi:phytoene synthase
VREEDLREARRSDAVRALLDFESRRARDHYIRAAEELPREDARRLAAARVMGAIYLNLLERIEMSGFDVFGAPLKVPRWRQAAIAASTWAAAMVGL